MCIRDRFIRLSTEKLTAVRSLFPDNLRSFGIYRIAEQYGPAFAHTEILGLMKAETAEISYRPQHSDVYKRQILVRLRDDFVHICAYTAKLFKITRNIIRRFFTRDSRCV